jgi:hypothetical protein
MILINSFLKQLNRLIIFGQIILIRLSALIRNHPKWTPFSKNTPYICVQCTYHHIQTTYTNKKQCYTTFDCDINSSMK